MSSPRLLLLLLLLAPPPLQSSLLSPLDTPEGKATITGLIFSALERAMSFLEKRLPEINLDGVVGFRVLEVQLQGVQEKWARDPRLRPLSLRVGELAEKLAPLLHRSISYLRLNDPEYLREFQPTIEPGFWKLPRAWTHTNDSMVYTSFEPQDSFSEEHSDLCLVQLLGTGTDSSQPCRLSDFCRNLMTKPGCSGYCLSHQMLFFLLAGMRGCTKGLFHQSQRYMDLFCANMMDLNRRAEAIGYAYPTRDVFMENIMFCGMGGFSDFYKLRWLEAILSWQKPQEGCFGPPAAEDEELPKDIHYQQHSLRRVKRREKQFTDGCSYHNTAVAVAALGGFLYILEEHPPADRELQPSAPTPLSSH
uniref:Chromosome 16 open reading frame 89 n=1 Tax=Catagonus wagneri TaxID=51154 RepID=A0A8C3YRY6_9CETA